MANREAWCADKLSKLLIEDLRISTLCEIKEHFSAISQDEAFQVANVMQLPIVFDCLNDSKTEQIDLACEVLSLCMNSLSLGESTSRYGASLERALYHPSANVKLMALKEIHRTASNAQSISELSLQVPIIIALVTCVGDDELSVAKSASEILTLVGRIQEGLRQILIPEIKRAFGDTILISDIVRFRVYEIIINIASFSEENLQHILRTGLISSLIAELDSDDILLRLNVIELLSTLALCNHGMVYLQGEGIIDKLHIQLATVNENPLGNLVAPGLLRFFGNVAHFRPSEINSLYPTSFTILFDVIISNDASLLGVALDTLGHIGIRNDGKLTLGNLEQQMSRVLQVLGTNLALLPTELRVRALNCVENLVRVLPNQQNNQVVSLANRWFRSLCPDPMSMIVKYAQNPFIDIRLAGLAVLQAIAEQSWGQEMIRNHPGLLEFLMDRRIENTKESKEIKFEVVRALSGSSVFSDDTRARLKHFVREGPFYVEAITEVAIEGSA